MWRGLLLSLLLLEALSIPIRAMPTSSGRTFELTLFTHDPDHPGSIALVEVP